MVSLAASHAVTRARKPFYFVRWLEGAVQALREASHEHRGAMNCLIMLIGDQCLNTLKPEGGASGFSGTVLVGGLAVGGKEFGGVKPDTSGCG